MANIQGVIEFRYIIKLIAFEQLMQAFAKRTFPRKSRDNLAIWSEFNQLALKYNSINLCHGTPGLNPPKFLLDNLDNAVRSGFNQYTMYSGHPLFRDKLSEFFSPLFSPALKGKQLNPNNEILVTNGASEALFCSAYNFVEEGDEVLVFEPYYTQYVNYAEFGGAKLITAPMTCQDGHWSYDFEAFERKITAQTKLVMITNPHNPTGKIFTKQELEKLTAILEKHPQIIVVSDDVYYFLPYDNKEYNLFANIGDNYKRTVTVFSAGKMLNATGWKIGWAIGPQELINHVAHIHEASCYNNNVPGQVAIARSLDQTLIPYEGHHNYFQFVRETFKEARDKAKNLLKLPKKLKFEPTDCESGYFMPIDISANKHLIPDKYFKPGNYEDDPQTTVKHREFTERVPLDYAFCRWLAIEKGLTLLPVSAFCLQESQKLTENYVRLAICKTPQFFEDKNLVQRFSSL